MNLNSELLLSCKKVDDYLDCNWSLILFFSCTSNVPMIPLGLKETTECDIEIPIKVIK